MSILLCLPAPETGSQFMEPERIKEAGHFKTYVALSELSHIKFLIMTCSSAKLER